jgi:CRISPR-associated protein Cas2
VRDELWSRAIKKSKESGAVLQIWTDQNPQGFSYRQYGDRERTIIDFEGLSLVKVERNSTINKAQNLDTKAL